MNSKGQDVEGVNDFPVFGVSYTVNLCCVISKNENNNSCLD